MATALKWALRILKIVFATFITLFMIAVLIFVFKNPEEETKPSPIAHSDTTSIPPTAAVTEQEIEYIDFTKPQPTIAPSFSPAHDAVLQHFKSEEESKVKDATWTANSILKLAVYNDGSSRNGYAEYACLKLNNYGFSGKKVWVQIIDYEKLVREEKFVRIGEAHCS